MGQARVLRKLILRPTSIFPVFCYSGKNIFHHTHPFACVLRKLYFDKSLIFNLLYRIILTINTSNKFRGDDAVITFTVSFFGHRVIEDPLRIEQNLESLIGRLITEHEYVEFLVGRDGEFDQLVSSVIRRCKRMLMYGKVSQENYVELTAASAIPNKEIKSPQILRY